MVVTNTPSQELALTNLAFISASDLPKFAVPGHDNLFLASIGDSYVFSFSYPPQTYFALIFHCFLYVRFSCLDLICYYLFFLILFISITIAMLNDDDLCANWWISYLWNCYLNLENTAHESIRGGHIALNSIQRRCAKVSSGESVDVARLVFRGLHFTDRHLVLTIHFAHELICYVV
jgi:hypothetical protein